MKTLFKHLNGKYYRLIKKRSTGVNTYLEVDSNNKPVIDNVGWSYHKQQQLAIISNTNNLTPL